MDIAKYDIISNKIDKSKPFYFSKRKSLVFKSTIAYNYYLECKSYNKDTNSNDYKLLLSRTLFNENCRKVHIDSYGRTMIQLHGELHDYVKNECSTRGNIDIEYLETEDCYDVYSVK